MKNNIFHRTVAVFSVIVLLILTYVPIFTISASASDDCPHYNWGEKLISHGNGYHTWIEYCTYCGYESGFVEMYCGVSYPGVCSCGYAPSCPHASYAHIGYVPGENQHCEVYSCYSCSFVFYGIDEDCTFENGVCKYCNGKYVAPDPADCEHEYINSVTCSKCGYVCKHEKELERTGIYEDIQHVVHWEEYHYEKLRCPDCKQIVGLDANNPDGEGNYVGKPHDFEDGVCSECYYECRHDYISGYCKWCKLPKELNLSAVDYGTYGSSLIFSKNVLYEKTDKGYYFVRSDEYIGGKNLLNLLFCKYGVLNTKNSEVVELLTNSITLSDKDGGLFSDGGRTYSFTGALSECVSGKTYTFSYRMKDNRPLYSGVYMSEIKPDGSINYYFSELYNGQTWYFTFEYDIRNQYTLIFCTTTSGAYGVPFIVTLDRIQLEVGDKPTTYEPFGVLRVYDYETTYKEGYQAAVKELGNDGNGSIVRSFMFSAFDIASESFEKLNKGTTINGISVGGVISTLIVIVFVFFIIKLIKR